MEIVYGGWEKRQLSNNVPKKKGARAPEATTSESKMMFTYRITRSPVTLPTCDINQSLTCGRVSSFPPQQFADFLFPSSGRNKNKKAQGRPKRNEEALLAGGWPCRVTAP